MRGCCLLLLAALAGPAAGAYITDKVTIGLYATPGVSGDPPRALAGGTPVEVLRQQGSYSEVRLPDRQQGWVESRHITQERSAQALLLETQARAAIARRHLDALQQELAQKDRLIAELQERLDGGSGTSKPNTMRPAGGGAPGESPGVSPWFAGAAGAALGFLLGMYLFLSRER